ncbi:MAG: hypothetical protein CVT62_08335 [Actinobacteria bacterium HGW-Actinobacteria-2]|nr:MAG: hypothetical protein CVT62_08335 [Actinobacteria bacterium HGW-Actinobacteria-2]
MTLKPVGQAVSLLVAGALIAMSLSGCAPSPSELQARCAEVTSQYQALPGVVDVRIDCALTVAGGWKHAESDAVVTFAAEAPTEQLVQLVRRLFAMEAEAKLGIYRPEFRLSSGSHFLAHDRVPLESLRYLIDAAKWQPNTVPEMDYSDLKVGVTIAEADPRRFLAQAAELLARPPQGPPGYPLAVRVSGPATSWEQSTHIATSDHALTPAEVKAFTDVGRWLPEGVLLVALSSYSGEAGGAIHTAKADRSAAAEFARRVAAVWPGAQFGFYQLKVVPNPNLPGKTRQSVTKYYP